MLDLVCCRSQDTNDCEPTAILEFMNDFAIIDMYLNEVFSVLLHSDYTVTPCLPSCPDYTAYSSALLAPPAQP